MKGEALPERDWGSDDDWDGSESDEEDSEGLILDEFMRRDS